MTEVYDYSNMPKVIRNYASMSSVYPAISPVEDIIYPEE
jgi:hypothetical protein